MSHPVSMTCFGRGGHEEGGRRWSVELRSVNHRYLEVAVRLPRPWPGVEDRVKKAVAQRFQRGKVDVFVSCRGEANVSLRLDRDLARQYHAGLVELQHLLGLAGEPDLALLAGYREIFATEEVEEDIDGLWAGIGPALTAALDQAAAMRRAEGGHLVADLLARLGRFDEMRQAVAARAPEVAEARHAQLRQRLEALLGEGGIDPARLAQEAAILADKADISEELVRLASHVEQFRDFLGRDEAVGRRLDFLLQEFLREINTMASKIAEVQVLHQVVEMKNEVEKLREQVQNLE